MTEFNKQALKPGLYAILFRNNWDGEGDTYETLASLDSNLIWHNHETGKELFEYEGDAVLKAWLLNDSTTTDALEAKDITLSARDYHFDQDAARIESLEKSLEAAEKRIAELEARSIGEHDLFLRAKALMYQSGGAPVEKSLNPVDAWLFDAEQATTKAPVLPPLNDDLVSILGRPNFMCSQFAEFLRMDGMEIRRKSEHEQAAVIHWFMNLYLQHGAGWGDVARAELERINRAAGIGVKGGVRWERQN